MPGKQANVTMRGAVNEDDAKAILRRLSSVIPVPRQDDYGIDFYCQEYSDETKTSHQVRSIYGVQIKPNLDEYALGNFDKKGQWKKYELTWYRTISIPCFLGIITNNGDQLAIYSLISLKCVFHKATSEPYIIKVNSKNSEHSFRYEEPVVNKKNTEFEEWICNLGSPIIQLNRAQLNEKGLLDNCKTVLNKWISIDRMNALFLSFGIDRVMSYKNWSPNIIHNNDEITIWDYWQKPLNTTVLNNISSIAGPCLALINKNYEESNRESLPGVNEIHHWMKENGFDDPYVSIFEKKV